MRPVYCGVEQEFQTYVKKEDTEAEKNEEFCEESVLFGYIFRKQLKKYTRKHFKKSRTAIRTRVGSSIYEDSGEAEICTPPVRIRKGFVNDFGETLKAARDEFAEFMEGSDVRLAGYSTHVNVSSHPVKHLPSEEALSLSAIPLGLFMLTPNTQRISWSTDRGNQHDERVEIQGDYIPSVEQTQAAVLLASAIVLGRDFIKTKVLVPSEYSFQFGGNDIYGLYRVDNPFFKQIRSDRTLERHGRNAKVMLEDGRTITAQECLEMVVCELSPVIYAIANVNEHKILRKFVEGKEELEIDKIDHYNSIADDYSRVDFSYKYSDTLTFDPTELHCDYNMRTLPAMARLYGCLAQKRLSITPDGNTGRRIKTKKMGWNYQRFLAGGAVCGFDSVESIDFTSWAIESQAHEREVLNSIGSAIFWLNTMPPEYILNFSHKDFTPSNIAEQTISELMRHDSEAYKITPAIREKIIQCFR